MSLWTPDQLNDLHTWIEARLQSGYSDADPVGTASDSSGNGYDFTAAGAARPTFNTNVLNGQPVFTFNGSNYLTSDEAASRWKFLHDTTGSTVIGVWKAGVAASPNALLSLCGTNAGSSSNHGMYLTYDDRDSQSRNNVLFSSCTTGGGLGTNSFINVSANDVHAANTGILVGHVGDPNNATDRGIFPILSNVYGSHVRA
jgi:hypothetical protein